MNDKTDLIGHHSLTTQLNRAILNLSSYYITIARITCDSLTIAFGPVPADDAVEFSSNGP